jgi:hypothetical protein
VGAKLQVVEPGGGDDHATRGQLPADVNGYVGVGTVQGPVLRGLRVRCERGSEDSSVESSDRPGSGSGGARRPLSPHLAGRILVKVQGACQHDSVVALGGLATDETIDDVAADALRVTLEWIAEAAAAPGP